MMYCSGVPTRTSRLACLGKHSPVTVTELSMMGLFFCTASYTARAVATFCTTAPTLMGRAPEPT